MIGPNDLILLLIDIFQALVRYIHRQQRVLLHLKFVVFDHGLSNCLHFTGCILRKDINI